MKNLPTELSTHEKPKATLQTNRQDRCKVEEATNLSPTAVTLEMSEWLTKLVFNASRRLIPRLPSKSVFKHLSPEYEADVQLTSDEAI
jgi:hypothetical protein